MDPTWSLFLVGSAHNPLKGGVHTASSDVQTTPAASAPPTVAVAQFWAPSRCLTFSPYLEGQVQPWRVQHALQTCLTLWQDWTQSCHLVTWSTDSFFFFFKKRATVPKCEVTAQDFAVDIVKGLLQVHKTHGDLTSKDPWPKWKVIWCNYKGRCIVVWVIPTRYLL